MRALARNPATLDVVRGTEVVKGDLLTGEGVTPALEGISTAYYLVHSMEAAEDDDFGGRDRRAAESFAAAAAAAGIERIVYFGGLVPRGGARSRHLASRLEVEEILLEGVPGSTAFRASVVIGAQSASFRLLVRLAERLRVLPLPAWQRYRTQPVDERDAIDYLALTPVRPEAAGRSLDVAGPDVLSYREIVEQIADLMGVGRFPLPLPATATRAASAVVSAVTEQPVELVRPLMESLDGDLLARDDEAARIYGLRPRPFRRAVEHALGDWEASEPLGAR